MKREPKNPSRRRYVWLTACAVVWTTWLATFFFHTGHFTPHRIVDVANGSLHHQEITLVGDPNYIRTWEAQRSSAAGFHCRFAGKLGLPEFLPYQSTFSPTLRCGMEPDVQFSMTSWAIPLWPALVLTGVPTGLLWWRHYPRRVPPGHCGQCGYNLRGNVSGVCPECGAAVAASKAAVVAENRKG